MKRLVEPELTDHMPPDDPRALHSRRDLRRLNWLMRHVDILQAAAAARLPQPPRQIADLGAGDGSLMLELAAKFHKQWPGVQVTLVDRQQAVPAATLMKFAGFGWHAEAVAADVFDWLPTARRMDVVFTNLFLHHFPDAKLAELLRLAAARTDLFVACETRRTWPSFAIARLLWLMGCHPVTRQDAIISMRAGFVGCEMSALWPADGGWQFKEHLAIMFTHLFVAHRKSA